MVHNGGKARGLGGVRARNLRFAADHRARQSSGLPVLDDGGEGWIRTSVRLRGQIYSLLPLTTRPPLQMAGRASLSRRAKWPRGTRLSMRGSGGSCAVGNGACLCAARSPPRCAPGKSCPRHDFPGAGEGNRTLVVSLEGFCSTIELHPPVGARALCHCLCTAVNCATTERLSAPAIESVPNQSWEIWHGGAAELAGTDTVGFGVDPG